MNIYLFSMIGEDDGALPMNDSEVELDSEFDSMNDSDLELVNKFDSMSDNE